MTASVKRDDSAGELTALEERSLVANTALNKEQDRRRELQNLSLVGKTFKYRNCYSCPDKPSDYWILYSKVFRMEKGGSLICHNFETDHYGDVRINFTRRRCFNLTSDYQEIPHAEFDRAWKKLQERIAKVNP